MSEQNLFTGLNGASNGQVVGLSKSIVGNNRFHKIVVQNPGYATMVMVRREIANTNSPNPQWADIGGTVSKSVERYSLFSAGFEYAIKIIAPAAQGSAATFYTTPLSPDDPNESAIMATMSGDNVAGLARDSSIIVIDGGPYEGLFATSALVYVCSDPDQSINERFGGIYRADGLNMLKLELYDEGVTLDNILTGTPPTTGDSGGGTSGGTGGDTGGGTGGGIDTTAHASLDMANVTYIEQGSTLNWLMAQTGVSGYTAGGALRTVAQGAGGQARDPLASRATDASPASGQHLWLRAHAQFANSTVGVQSAGQTGSRVDVNIPNVGQWTWIYCGIYREFSESITLYGTHEGVSIDRAYLTPITANYLPSGAEGRSGVAGTPPDVNGTGSDTGGGGDTGATDGYDTNRAFERKDAADILYSETGINAQAITIGTKAGFTGTGALQVNKIESTVTSRAKVFLTDIAESTEERDAYIRVWADESGTVGFKSNQSTERSVQVTALSQWQWVYAGPWAAYDRQIRLTIDRTGIFVDAVIVIAKGENNPPVGEQGYK